jgi:hypothetical protein
MPAPAKLEPLRFRGVQSWCAFESSLSRLQCTAEENWLHYEFMCPSVKAYFFTLFLLLLAASQRVYRCKMCM